MTEKELKLRITNLHLRISKDKQELLQLQYDLSLMDYSKFVTEDYNLGTKRKPNILPVKWGLYKQKFQDGDTKKYITIERRNPVEIDGKKCDQLFNVLDL
jgi:hypothetical protein